MINKISKTWNKNSSFFKFLKTILKKNYNKNNEIITLFNKVKPELLLLKFMFENDKKLLEHFKKKNEGIGNGYTLLYMSFFLKKLNVNVLDITHIGNNKYLFNFNKHYIKNATILQNYYYELSYFNIIKNLKILKKIYNFNYTFNIEKELNEIKKSIVNIPDVLLVTLCDEEFNKYMTKNEYIYNLLGDINYNINLDDLNKLKNKINFNGHIYKLDSVLIGNYNVLKINKGHTISGITCNNKKYIYNGWSKNVNIFYNNYILNESCKLQKFNWNVNKEKIFGFKSSNCKLTEDINENKDITYSFTKSERILIYVKIDKNKTSSIKSSSTSSLSKTQKIIKDYYNVKNLQDIKKINY